MPIETAQRPDMKEPILWIERYRADAPTINGARSLVYERAELQADLVAIRERVLVDPRWVRETS